MSRFAHLSREQLIERLERLEAVSHPVSPAPFATKVSRPFDFAAQPRRKIALRFCYLGTDYSGLAIQEDKTPLPTVESVLFAALARLRLVDPDKGLDGCGWSRCGRTDRGVSAAGQVISLWVRSNIGKMRKQHTGASNLNFDAEEESEAVAKQTELPLPELPYMHSLNHALPPNIRVVAWSPVSDHFDARFSCSYRHYKYIFSSGRAPNRLDIDTMRDAAARLEGEHDFRNLCKLDPTKQIENFSRRVLQATIEPLKLASDDEDLIPFTTDTRGLFVFNLKGTAFLYHQVRHIMAILFLIGSRLEPPSIIDTLLNTSKSPNHSSLYPFVDTKPYYRMADPLPLVLWDCGFSEADVQWRTDDQQPYHGNSPPADALTSLLRDLHTSWTRDLISTSISSLFLQAASGLLPPPTQQSNGNRYSLGGGMMQTEARYIPLLERPRGGNITDANAKWREGARGRRNTEKMVRRMAERLASVANNEDRAASESES